MAALTRSDAEDPKRLSLGFEVVPRLQGGVLMGQLLRKRKEEMWAPEQGRTKY